MYNDRVFYRPITNSSSTAIIGDSQSWNVSDGFYFLFDRHFSENFRQIINLVRGEIVKIRSVILVLNARFSPEPVHVLLLPTYHSNFPPETNIRNIKPTEERQIKTKTSAEFSYSTVGFSIHFQ